MDECSSDPAITSDEPYKVTPTFTQATLPDALRKAHSTKAGVWGVIRVLEGRVDYVIESAGTRRVLHPQAPGLVKPEELHHVEPLGTVRMRVEFHRAFPAELA